MRPPWYLMQANESTEGALAQAIDSELGGFYAFEEAFTKAALTRLRQRLGVALLGRAKAPRGGKHR